MTQQDTEGIVNKGVMRSVLLSALAAGCWMWVHTAGAQTSDTAAPVTPRDEAAASGAATGGVDTAVEAVTDVARIEDTAQTPDATVRTGESGAQLISISLDNVPLEDVVRMFTRISGANIIATGTNLEGTVTVNLVDVEWKPALSAILGMHNLSLVEKIPGSGVYSILPKQADVPEPLIVETVFLNYTTVNDVSPVIKSMLTQGGILSPFNSRNAMVLRTTSANLGEIKQVLKLIDIPGQQVCIETQFMELSDRASKQLGIKWDGLEEFGASLALGPFSYDRETVTENSSEDAYRRYTDNESSDVLNESYDENGVQIDNTTAARTITDTISGGEENSTDLLNSFTETITEKQSAILDVDSFSVILSALKRTDGVSIVSNPKLVVANGEEGAFFSVGEREPIIRTEVTLGTQDSPGDKVTAELDTDVNTDYIKEGYLETGIELKVAPVIKSEGLIEALITPSLRRKTGEKAVEIPRGAGSVDETKNSWPIIEVKEIRTRFTLRDGQTVAIGGLTYAKDGKETTKVPLLGDIPLIGKYLFSHTKDVKDQVETIIFVTLALAQPESLNRDKGIPMNAELVHKQVIKDRIRHKKLADELARMQQAADDEIGAPAPAASEPATTNVPPVAPQ